MNNAADSAIVFSYKAASDKYLVSKNKQDSGISMEEIDRKIDEMPVFDLKDPKERKQTNINIDEILNSLDFEALLTARNVSDVKKTDKQDYPGEPDKD